MKFAENLLFISLAVFALTACDPGNVHVENEGWTRETTSLADDPLLGDALGNFKSNNENGRIENQFGDLNLDEVSKVSNDSLTRYSLLFNSVEAGSFANLILTDTEEGSTAYIIQYVPDGNWYDEYGYDEANWDMFTGKIIYYDTDGIEFARSCMIDGLAASCDQSSGGGRTEDEVVIECVTTYRHWKVCIGNNCSYHSEVIDHQCTTEYRGSSGYGDDPDDPWGSGEDPRDCQYNAVGDCEPRTPPTPVSKPISCGRGFYLVNGVCVSPEDAWEDEIVLALNFKNDPCLMEIWNAALDSDAAYYLLRNFLGESPTADLELAIPTLSEYLSIDGRLEAWAITQNYPQEIYIYFNERKLRNSSQMLFVAVMAHEFIHAEIFRKLGTLPTNSEGYIDPVAYKHNFPGLFDYLTSSPNGQHNAMANHYRPQIVDFMRSMDIALNGSDANSDLYEALSWLGLKGTVGWNQLSSTKKNDFSNKQDTEDEKGRCD